VIDIVPGARTVLLGLADPGYQRTSRAQLAGIALPRPAECSETAVADVVIEVVYDGADLNEVAGRLDMTVVEIIEAHTATPWRVGFGGFAPGFAYLVGGDARLNVPRRPEPRTRVPAGSVGLAGEFSGIYPRESPGGWQLIGRTEAVLWDIERVQPALLRPGMWVQFRAAGTT
jgi:KipI family sensor histidine kinase inhibitor